MEIKQLNTFLVVAKHLHFGRAAEQLRLAQPHVSRRIRQLEDELNVTLFDRSSRSVQLTEAGRVLYDEAQILLRDVDLARQHVRESALGRRGKLSVGLLGSAMLDVLPEILSTFHASHPDVHLSFLEVGSVHQLDALSEGNIDIAFLHPPMRGTGLYAHKKVRSDPLCALLPASHPLANRKEIELSELANDNWIMFPRDDNSPIFDRVISACEQVGFSPKIIQEAGPVHTRFGLVSAGYGVHIGGSAWRKMPFPGIVYVAIKNSPSLGLYCYWRQNDSNPILKLFLDVVNKYELVD